MNPLGPKYQKMNLSSHIHTNSTNNYYHFPLTEFSQRGFLVPTWYVGILQMTVGIATAILAITEILLPTGSETHYGKS